MARLDEEHPFAKKGRDQWGPTGTRRTDHSENTIARLKAPGVTAALGWRDRCWNREP
jgi:hypothetical protein